MFELVRFAISPFFVLLFLAIAAWGQQERVAIINTVDDRDSISFSDLVHLTNRLRETAVKILPKSRYGVMTTESIVAFLGDSQERAAKVCNQASCLAEIGRKVNADYVAQARIGRFGGELSINFELYNSKSGNLIDQFTGSNKKIFGLLAIIDEKAPDLFKKMPGVLSGSKDSPLVAGGIGGVQTTSGDYELEGSKSYLANISTEPEGAFLSFDGVPNSRCAKTPCKVVLAEGSARIVAVLEQYEKADTTVSIKQNNQIINIRLKPNFGVLEIKPAYSENIGSSKSWSLAINGKASSSFENRLSPGNYEVKLSHECYEDISFKAGINKDKREIFDMAGYIKLKKGGLVLNVERNGEPAVELVYANGKQVGETPFSGTVPICAEIELGKSREKVGIKLRHNEKVSHTVKIGGVNGGSFVDSRDGKKYKTTKIGNQVWMAENLNYNANGSKCYKNQESNCKKYGRLYNWNTARATCPKSWHLPSKSEWEVLTATVDGEKTEAKHLKTKAGWNNNGNGLDSYGFSALPGGNGYFNDFFENIGESGFWWSASEYNSSSAYFRIICDEEENAEWGDIDKSGFFISVRCLQD